MTDSTQPKQYDEDDNDEDENDSTESYIPTIGSTVVMDCGTYNMRIGISGERKPQIIENTTDWNMIGDQTEQPIIQGQIQKWDAIEERMKHMLEQKLKFETEEHPIVCTEPYDIPHASREKLTEIVFESIQAPAFYVSPSNLFSLFSTGRTTGVVIDMAYDVSRIVPIYEGYVLKYNALNFACGGQHLSHALATMLEENIQISQYKNVFTSAVLEDIKRKHCIVQCKDEISVMLNSKNINNSSEKKSDENVSEPVMYTLPDGQTIEFSSERVECNEMMFGAKVDVLSDDDLSVQNLSFTQCIYHCISKCADENQSEMFSNLILCGGTSAMSGMKLRLKHELKQESITQLMSYSPSQSPAVNDDKMHLAAMPNESRHISAWIGASIFSSLSSFASAFITMEDYTECGARIVQHKCF